MSYPDSIPMGISLSIPSSIRSDVRPQAIPSRMEIGKRLAALREARGWSINQLAREASLNQSTVWRVESGLTKKPGIEIASKLANALGVPVEDLMPEDGTMRPGDRLRSLEVRVSDLERDLRDTVKDQRAALAALRRHLDAQAAPRKKPKRS